MTIAQKMLDERRIGYWDGKEEMLKINIIALKGILDPAIIAEQFKVPPNQVIDILNCN